MGLESKTDLANIYETSPFLRNADSAKKLHNRAGTGRKDTRNYKYLLNSFINTRK